MITGPDRLSYQSRWIHVLLVRKFLPWLVMMILAFTLPPLGQGIELLLIAALSYRLSCISSRCRCYWTVPPLDSLTVGVVTILFSISRDPQILLASIPMRSYWLGINVPGVVIANETFWRSPVALAATSWLVLNLPFPQSTVLPKHAYTPRLLTERILLTWRFIFILLDEALTIHHVQMLRFGHRSLLLDYRLLAMLVGSLSTRMLICYQQMTTTLDIKLYQGDLHL